MKKIGLIGGMSWESSQVYYRIINEKVRELLGGFHSCISVMESADFAVIEELQHKDDWESLNSLMVESVKTWKRQKLKLLCYVRIQCTCAVIK